MKKIISDSDLRKILMSVNMPGRYSGGEFGSIYKDDADFKVALCFPDLYEIGMSNLAVKILYSIINSETEAACERVFNPAPDLEEKLVENKIPLFSIETRKKIHDFDILAFTVGYELAATNILNVLELSGISLRNSEREDDEPIVIAGGPAITNPIPFGDFIDAVYIGEAEDILPEIVNDLQEKKRKGASRSELLEEIKSSDYFWYKGRTETVNKAVWRGFSSNNKNYRLLVPSISTVQDHGVVEIMRGCPNGCRFCHAGIFYRPYREKGIDKIIEEVENLIRVCGYREITLSSLSSGDYKYIGELIKFLNEKYESEKISFSFPSIRINSFTLPLISEISKVRKSGLTFAVETPDLMHQRGNNKEAPKERIIEILKEAKKLGWNKAKFYFMVGLPFFQEDEETDAIIDFMREVGRETKMQLNLNVGTFIPKPHTPFQWSFQLSEEEAFRRLIKIKKALPDKFFKVGFQSPFISFIEGMISRGDERSGELVMQAYEKGARLDAWEEYMNKQAWRDVFQNADWDVEKEICSRKDVKEDLTWDIISLGAGSKFYKKEYEKALNSELTEACAEECNHNCGACNNSDRVIINNDFNTDKYKIKSDLKTEKETMNQKILFSFTKDSRAAYLSHINIMNVFERAFLRAGLTLRYTEGFNPKPKLEFANPLTLGFESEEEVASVEIKVSESIDKIETAERFKIEMNKSLPEGIKIITAKVIKAIASVETGKKVKSLMSTYNGGRYEVFLDNTIDRSKLISCLEKYKNVKYDLKDEAVTILTSKDDNGKILNIFKFFKEDLEYELPFNHISVKRTDTYCGMDKNSGSEKSYFESYE